MRWRRRLGQGLLVVAMAEGRACWRSDGGAHIGHACVASAKPLGFLAPGLKPQPGIWGPATRAISSSTRRAARQTQRGRPSLDDVERLSKGQAAKKRGTGSRAICHRLNEMERREFDLAKKMGFVQLRGTGYRRERKGSPLANIHRQLCDALARPCIEIHRGLGTDAVDSVVVDVSPLRPTELEGLQGPLQALQGIKEQLGVGVDEMQDGGAWEETWAAFDEDAWEEKAIWELPMLSFVFETPSGDRSLAKKIAQEVAALYPSPRK